MDAAEGVVVADLLTAAGAVMAGRLNRLPPEHQQAVADALARGARASCTVLAPDPSGRGGAVSLALHAPGGEVLELARLELP